MTFTKNRRQRLVSTEKFFRWRRHPALRLVLVQQTDHSRRTVTFHTLAMLNTFLRNQRTEAKARKLAERRAA